MFLSFLAVATVACGPVQLEGNLEKYDNLAQTALHQLQPGATILADDANYELALVMKNLNIESIYIDTNIKYIALNGSSNILIGQRGYLYNIELNEKELSEMNQPESSRFLEKVSDKWYRSEVNFD